MLVYVKNLGKGLKIGLKSSSIIIVIDTDIGLRMHLHFVPRNHQMLYNVPDLE